MLAQKSANSSVKHFLALFADASKVSAKMCNVEQYVACVHFSKLHDKCTAALVSHFCSHLVHPFLTLSRENSYNPNVLTCVNSAKTYIHKFVTLLSHCCLHFQVKKK